MVNIYKPELTNLQQSILSFLFIKPTKKFNMVRLAHYLEVSQPAIKKAIPKLQKKKLVLVKKDSVSKRYSIKLNRESSHVIHLKRVENMKRIYLSRLFSFLFNVFPGSTLILFGSYSYGEDVENSDIDIAILGCKEKQLDLSKFERVLDREISLNFYDSFKNIKDENLKNNILNGVLFSGGVDL